MDVIANKSKRSIKGFVAMYAMLGIALASCQSTGCHRPVGKAKLLTVRLASMHYSYFFESSALEHLSPEPPSLLPSEVALNACVHSLSLSHIEDSILSSSPRGLQNRSPSAQMLRIKKPFVRCVDIDPPDALMRFIGHQVDFMEIDSVVVAVRNGQTAEIVINACPVGGSDQDTDGGRNCGDVALQSLRLVVSSSLELSEVHLRTMFYDGSIVARRYEDIEKVSSSLEHGLGSASSPLRGVFFMGAQHFAHGALRNLVVIISVQDI